MTTPECFICTRIEMIKQNENPYFVREMETGYVVLGDNQFYRGLSFFLSKIHARELHHLPAAQRDLFLKEMGIVAEAVHNAFHPNKLNYELLGNNDEHLHWWLVPRSTDDPNPKMPIWVLDRSINFSGATNATPEDLAEMIPKLQHELDLLINID